MIYDTHTIRYHTNTISEKRKKGELLIKRMKSAQELCSLSSSKDLLVNNTQRKLPSVGEVKHHL